MIDLQSFIWVEGSDEYGLRPGIVEPHFWGRGEDSSAEILLQRLTFSRFKLEVCLDDDRGTALLGL